MVPFWVAGEEDEIVRTAAIGFHEADDAGVEIDHLVAVEAVQSDVANSRGGLTRHAVPPWWWVAAARAGDNAAWAWRPVTAC
jgi:hypothetical protein